MQTRWPHLALVVQTLPFDKLFPDMLLSSLCKPVATIGVQNSTGLHQFLGLVTPRASDEGSDPDLSATLQVQHPQTFQVKFPQR